MRFGVRAELNGVVSRTCFYVSCFANDKGKSRLCLFIMIMAEGPLAVVKEAICNMKVEVRRLVWNPSIVLS